MSFKREELQGTRERAQTLSEIKYLAPTWKRAYEKLADATNNLDAMIARTEVHVDE